MTPALKKSLIVALTIVGAIIATVLTMLKEPAPVVTPAVEETPVVEEPVKVEEAIAPLALPEEDAEPAPAAVEE